MTNKDIQDTISDLIKNQRYIRKDSETGFTEQKAEIARLKASHKIKCMTQKMLGNFDESGEYIIDEEIMNELIALPKFIDKEENGALYLSCEYKDGEIFKFICPKPMLLPDGSMYCTLVLNEEIEYGNGYVIDTISTVVGAFNCARQLVKNCDALIRKVFHIYKRDDHDAKTRKPTDAIDAKMKYLEALWNSIKAKAEEIEEKYYNRRIEIMSGIQEGPAFLREFSNLTQSLENFFLKGSVGNRFATLNDLLNIMIDGNIGQPIKENPHFDQVMYGLDLEYLTSIGVLVSKAMTSRLVKTAANTLTTALTQSNTAPEPVETQQPTAQPEAIQTESQLEKEQAEAIKRTVEKQKQEKLKKQTKQPKVEQKEQERVM